MRTAVKVWGAALLFLALFALGCAEDGKKGAAGAPGAPGADGTDGTNGADGADGADGANGDPGADGQDGVNGDAGIDGVDGEDGEDYVSSKTFKDIELTVLSVSNNGGALAVTFSASDNGNPITNLTMDPIRMMFNQYLPKAAAYDNAVWSVDVFYERGSTTDADLRLVQDPLGTYTYTFLETIAEGVTDDDVDVTLPTQLAMRISDFESYNRINAIYQITEIPMTDGEVATEVATAVGNIVETSACETCHGPRIGHVGHGGGYNKVEYCRNCHTQDDDEFVTDGLDLRQMIHQIHAEIDHTNGDVDPGFDWSEVTYPQEIRNCTKCHQGIDGENWNLLPTREACNNCHYDVDFDTGTNHVGGAQATNSACQTCHSSTAIRGYHATENATTYNPDVPAGVVNFEYVINSVTVNGSGQPTINFAILADGVAMTDLHTTYPPTGFTDGPSFLVTYAQPQDGIAAADMVDWNNLGKSGGQPESVPLAELQAGTSGSLTFNDSDDTYDAVITEAVSLFPAGSTMRTVTLQGYFTQTSPAYSRHTTSVVAVADGDDDRRAVLNVSGCVDCHEFFEGHGGNRVFSAATDEDTAVVCLTCHVPNLSSSGRTFDTGSYTYGTNSNTDNAIDMFGSNGMLWPEDTNNFKDLIHGIHSSSLREDPYEFVRVRSGNAYGFDWSEVTFPARDTSNCQKCHKEETYWIDEIPEDALASNKETNNGAITDFNSVVTARASVPNDDDLVLAPVVAACNSCHNGAMIEAHMDGAGGNFGLTRDELANASPAQCAICHDSGSMSDVELMHEGLDQ